jgi:hypothetical protein
MSKKLRVCVAAILAPLLGAWSLSLWFGYTVPVILHEGHCGQVAG